MGTPTPVPAPNTVYLCQVSPNVSCGACCGLYNVTDPSRENLEAMLMRRTGWFAAVPRTLTGIDAFKSIVESTEPQERPFPDFHHCVFLGMIEDGGRRVGCLLHPLSEGNGGVDWPFRRQGAPGVCNYFFEDGLYPRPAVKRQTKTIPTSRFEKLFQELDSGFSSADRIERAESMIESLLISLEMVQTSN